MHPSPSCLHHLFTGGHSSTQNSTFQLIARDTPSESICSDGPAVFQHGAYVAVINNTPCPELRRQLAGLERAPGAASGPLQCDLWAARTSNVTNDLTMSPETGVHFLGPGCSLKPWSKATILETIFEAAGIDATTLSKSLVE